MWNTGQSGKITIPIMRHCENETTEWKLSNENPVNAYKTVIIHFTRYIYARIFIK